MCFVFVNMLRGHGQKKIDLHWVMFTGQHLKKKKLVPCGIIQLYRTSSTNFDLPTNNVQRSAKNLSIGSLLIAFAVIIFVQARTSNI